jgi:hypothetical protein
METKFKSKAQVLKENAKFKKLINAVYKELGDDREEVENEIENIYTAGMDGGIGNFIYYEDTHKFASKYQKQIVELLTDTANMLGEDEIEMVSNFGVFRRNKMDSQDKRDLYAYLSGVPIRQGTITNIMCWFAVEEVARWFEAE